MVNNDKKRRLLLLLITMIVISLAVVVIRFIRNTFSPTDIDVISLYITLAEAFGLVISLSVAIFQLIDSKEISRASFITELNKSYVENEDFIGLYNKLQQCIDGDCGLREGTYDYFTESDHDCLADVKKSEISNYLTFFETLYILYCRGGIKFQIIDDLFAYRFFMAVHSRIFQQRKLKPQPENFKNIYRLEYKWMYYHSKPKNKVLKAAGHTKDVYSARLLINLVEGDVYCRLVGITRRAYCRFMKKFLGINISPKEYSGAKTPSDYIIFRRDTDEPATSV